MIGVQDRETLLDLLPNWGALRRVCESMAVPAAYAYAPGGHDPKTSLCARFFDPFSQYEDPFTGSACGAMAALAARNGLVTEKELVIEQGESVGRLGYATVNLHDMEKNILVGGSAARVLSGTICAPLESSRAA